MADEKIGIEVSLEGDAAGEFKKLTGTIKTFETESSKSLLNFKKVAEIATGVFAADAVRSGVVAFKNLVVGAFNELVVEGVANSQEAQVALNDLNQALAQSGNFSEQASQDFQEFADALQSTTTAEDDTIIKTAALIERLTGLKEEGLEQATQAALDLSTVLGGDLNSAGLLLAKTANGNVAALKKYGIEVQKGATDSETFANAIEAINAKLGGAAASQLNTFSGAIKQLGVTYGNTQEAVGDAVVKNTTFIAVIREVNTILNEYRQQLLGANGSLKDAFGQGLIQAIQITNQFIVGLDALVRAGQAAFALLTAPVNAFVASLVAGQRALEGDFAGALEALKGPGEDLAQSLDKAFNGDSALGKVSEDLFRIEEAANRGFAAMKAGADGSVKPINQARDAVKELTEEQIKQGQEGEKLAQKLLEQDPSIKYERDLEALKAAKEQELITEQEFIDAKAERDLALEEEESKKREEQINKLLERNENLRLLDEEKNQAEIDANKAKVDQILKQEQENSDLVIATKSKQKQAEAKIDKERLQAGTAAIDQLASLQNAKTKELAAVGKAAAISRAIIDTYVGASAAATALAGIPLVGPALAAAAAAAFITAGFARVAAIQGTPLATGIDSVPGTGNRDNFPAILAPGERVVPKKTNQDLTEFLAGQNMNDLLTSINDRLGRLQNQFVVNVGEREIINVIRDAQLSGRVLT